MSHLKLIGATAAASAALLIGFAPLAQSHDEVWHQLEITDGYTPSPSHSANEKAATNQAPQAGRGTEFVGTGAKKETQLQSTDSCDHWAEVIRQSDGYTTMRC